MDDLAAYASLFLAAFLAPTLFPLPSEAAVAAMLAGGHSPVLVVAVASVANVAGSTINWLLGRWIERFRERRWFPVRPETLGRAQGWYRRWGKWSLLLSWVPVIGDPLTLVAGVMREKLLPFVILVAIGKVARYLVLAWAVLRV